MFVDSIDIQQFSKIFDSALKIFKMCLSALKIFEISGKTKLISGISDFFYIKWVQDSKPIYL